MTREKYTPTPEQAALKSAVEALQINNKTAEEIIDRATSLLRGARLLLKDENNDSVEEILLTVEDELFSVLHTIQTDEEPGEYRIVLTKTLNI